MKTKLLYIIRHGETDFNKLGIVQGSGIDKPLNELGIKQAEKFYRYYKEIKFKKIFTSSLIRTQQSVLPFIEAGYPYQATEALNEISWGVFEGRPQSEEERKIYWGVVNSWKNGDYHAKVKGGESAYELQNRQRPFIQYIHGIQDDCILISMHGRALKSFLCTLLDLPLSEMEKFEHSNLCLYIVALENGVASVLKHSDTTHLK